MLKVLQSFGPHGLKMMPIKSAKKKKMKTAKKKRKINEKKEKEYSYNKYNIIK